MDAGHVLRQLRAVGVDVTITESGLVVEGSRTKLLPTGSRPATPSDLARLTVSVPAATGIRPVVTAHRASAAAAAWLRAHPDVTLVLDDAVFVNGEEYRVTDTAAISPRTRGPRPYARFATARALLSGAVRENQVRLAELAGVSQGSVSNALRQIDPVIDPASMFDDLVRDYPGPGGQVYYWWSSRLLQEQCQQAAARGALISGDFAADRIAPWRMPEHVVAYVDSPFDLSPAGYVLSDRNDYTMMVVVAAADPTLTATASTWHVGGDIVDPIIAAYDVLRTATTGDEDEAVARLREFVVNRYEEATRD